MEKIRVYGKAQNRTALGIMHAYLTMFPHATAEDISKSFPKELNPDCAVPSIFKPLSVVEALPENRIGFWFVEPDEVLKFQDGTKFCLVKMWTKTSFENLVSHAEQYGIVVAEFEKGMKGQKGGYRLEYLNGYVPPVPEKKKSKLWIWLVLVFVVIAALLSWLFLRPEKVVEVEKVVTKVDTVYIQQLQEIENNYNAAEFVQGKAELSESAKFVLHDLAKVMNQNPNLRLRLEGHTSAEGDANFNQKLSLERAQAAVEFLVKERGIEAGRLEAVGYGATKLKNTNDPSASENRRTEFVVIE